MANAKGAIAIIGGILMVVGVFLCWNQITLDVVLDKAVYEYSGWKVYSDPNDYLTYKYGTAPLIVLICGAVTVLIAIIGASYRNNATKMVGAIILMMAVACGFMMYLFYSDVVGEFSLGATFSSAVGMGFYICMIGAVLSFFGGIVDLATNAVKGE